MTDLPLDIMDDDGNIDESRRAANERARYLARHHDLRDPVAWSVAIAEQGKAIPKRIGATQSTVKGYLDDIEERFGFEHTVWKPPEERHGALNETDADAAEVEA